MSDAAGDAIRRWWYHEKPALERKIEEAHSHQKQALQDLQFALQKYPHYIGLGGWIHA